MTLPKRLTAEKATTVKIRNTVFPISALPEEIRDEFGLLDTMKQDLAEVLYKAEILSMAINYKNDDIRKKLELLVTTPPSENV